MGRMTGFTPHAQRNLLMIPRPAALRILYRLAELHKAMGAGTPRCSTSRPSEGTVPAGGSRSATTASSVPWRDRHPYGLGQ